VQHELEAVFNIGRREAQIHSCSVDNAHSYARTNKKKMESYSCNYRGDYSIDPKPTTFDEAIQAYKKLNDKSTIKSPKSLIFAAVHATRMN
jgi:predicted nuclease of restriction endonuclease-like (RecB) superfamily